MSRTVFLDRDGTINQEVDYCGDPAQLELLPGAADAIRRLCEAGYRCVVTTNQSGVARGYFDERALARVRDSLQAEEAREPSPARKAVVERCRAVVVDYSSDVGRVAKQLRKNADRAKLFSGADDVVDLEGGPDHLKGVHRERKATTNALRGVGDVIEQAHEAQSDLASQRETLEGSTNTAQSLTDRLPSIDSIIQKMRQKKYRENAVVGVTVGCCASFLLWAVLT